MQHTVTGPLGATSPVALADPPEGQVPWLKTANPTVRTPHCPSTEPLWSSLKETQFPFGGIVANVPWLEQLLYLEIRTPQVLEKQPQLPPEAAPQEHPLASQLRVSTTLPSKYRVFLLKGDPAGHA